MKISRTTVAVVLASLSLPMMAHAEQAVGKLTAVSDGTFVSRDGRVSPAYLNQALYSGDRVITRANGSAKVAMQGCSYSMAPASMLSVGATPCGVTPVSFSTVTDSSSGGGGGAAAGDNTLLYVGGALAVGGIIAGVALSQHSPASPQ